MRASAILRALLATLRLLGGVGAIPLLSTVGASSPAPTAIPVERDYVVRAWRKEHGLPDNRVLSLLGSRDGMLWAGTRAGVVRFDGQRFETWSQSTHPVFAHSPCRALAEGPSGLIYAGTGQGVYHIGEEVARPALRIAPRAGAGWESTPMVNDIVVTRAGSFLVAGDFGFLRGEAGGVMEELFPLYKDHYHLPYTRIVEQADGAILIGTAGQMFRWTGGESDPVPQLPETSDVRTQCVHDLVRATDGTVLALIGNWEDNVAWLHRLDPTGWTRVLDQPLKNHSNPLWMAPAADGGVWVCNDFQHIAHWRAGVLRVFSLSTALGNAVPLCLEEWSDGTIWIGTALDGLVCLLPRAARQVGPADGLPHPSAWALLEASDGALWVGTDGGVARFGEEGVMVLDKKSGLGSNRIRALAEDAEGRVWIGTGAGLHIWESGALQKVPFEGEWFRGKIRAVYRARDGVLWVGTASGLHRLDQGGRRSWTTGDGLPAEDVRAIHEDGRGDVWLGTFRGGLARLRSDGFKVFGRAEGLPGTTVWAIHEDPEGRLWLGTDGGLACLHDERIVALNGTHGLPDDAINDLVSDTRGWIWLGHDRGICRARRDDLAAAVEGRAASVRCIPYDEDDGLHHREVNGQISRPAALRLRDGRVAFATMAGVQVFDPAQLPEPADGPTVRIERFTAGGRVLVSGAPGTTPTGPGGGAIAVPPDLRQPVEIRFTAPAFRSGDRVRFRYRLLGLSSDWADNGTVRSVSFAHLGPGSYVFEAVAVDHQGQVSARPTRLDFSIRPRLVEYRTFQVAAVAALVGMVVWLVRWRMLEVRRFHQYEAEARLAQERDRLARDLHDGLGASLAEISVISRPVQSDGLTKEALRQRLEVVGDRTAEIQASMRDMVWVTTPEADTASALVSRLVDQAQQVLRACLKTPELGKSTSSSSLTAEM